MKTEGVGTLGPQGEAASHCCGGSGRGSKSVGEEWKPTKENAGGSIQCSVGSAWGAGAHGLGEVGAAGVIPIQNLDGDDVMRNCDDLRPDKESEGGSYDTSNNRAIDYEMSAIHGEEQVFAAITQRNGALGISVGAGQSNSTARTTGVCRNVTKRLGALY